MIIENVVSGLLMILDLICLISRPQGGYSHSLWKYVTPAVLATAGMPWRGPTVYRCYTRDSRS